MTDTDEELIHVCDALSAPLDLLTRPAVRKLNQQTALTTKEVISASKKMALCPSGGTIESISRKPHVDPKTATESQVACPWRCGP